MEYLDGKRKSQKMSTTPCNIGLVGLGVMGRSLALNMASKGFQVAVYNYIPEVTREFLSDGKPGLNGTYSYKELAQCLERPRKVFLMVTAGAAVDQVIAELEKVLESGDVIIDGGNSDFHDKAISAKVDDGTPCCDWVGSGGAGHFVKMVHNGIEYGDIELICECYQLMRDGLGMTNAQMQETFSRWNHGDLDSFLIGITADILGKKDTEGRYILDTILDTAGQKGTGKWTVQAALDQGIPLSLISESVFARCLSSRKEERVSASAVLDGPAQKRLHLDLEDLRKTLLAAKIVSYAQGFSLMDSASKQYGWQLDLGAVALLWRSGCIIRSVFLGRIKDAYEAQPGLTNLMLSPWFRDTLAQGQAAWRRVVSEAVLHGIPVPSLSAGLNYYDGYRCASLPANLLQAQRDYFGAHTYERTDRPRGEFFHTEWL